MADWGSGYVTDTAYVHDFCRVQTPAILSLAALSKGVAVPGGRGEPLTYCDLGCGQGFTANLVAAANPQAEVFAADFNPTHIAGARALADAAGLKNVQFREAGFDEISSRSWARNSIAFTRTFRRSSIGLRRLPASYLAHELLTRDWQAFSFADVAIELAEAKLTYVAPPT